MTPIESKFDVRLVTLIGVAINTIESLALCADTDPEQILAESLYLSNKRISEVGEESYLMKLSKQYPILEQAIK